MSSSATKPRDLLRAAAAGNPTAVARVRTASSRQILASAQLALAREYGFSSWARLKTEVERRDILNSRDVARVTSLLTDDPHRAVERMVNWSDHKSTNPLAYIAMIGFDHERLGLPNKLPGTGDVARALIDAGAPVDGLPDDSETPLMTAASYGELEVARVLVAAGADIDTRARPDSGGVPGATLMHAAVFGMTDVRDLLVGAGGQAHGIESAAAIGDVSGWLTPDTDLQSRIRALIFAADHQRLNVIDELVGRDTPVDAVDEMFARQAWRVAAQHGRPLSVQRLLLHGADPQLRDEHGRTALDLCQPGQRYLDSPGHDEVDAILRSITRPRIPEARDGKNSAAGGISQGIDKRTF